MFSYKSQYRNSLEAAQIGIKADSTNEYLITNLPLALIFNNRYDEAVKVYSKYKDQPCPDIPEFKTYREVFQADIDDFEQKGITHPDFVKVRELLRNK
jgi:hypothetical protein